MKTAFLIRKLQGNHHFFEVAKLTFGFNIRKEQLRKNFYNFFSTNILFDSTTPESEQLRTNLKSVLFINPDS